jgi:AcrR family transcriptional regulator
MFSKGDDMDERDLEAKERILQRTMEMLNEVEDVDTITMRQIAERAQVGIGLINYHYQSKDNLFNEAVGRLMGDQAARWYEPFDREEVDPVSRLKMLLIETANIAFRYEKLSHITVSHALLHGNMEPAQLILPLLRDIFGGSKDETELRLIAFQLITTMQVIFLRASAFRLYSGIDIYDEVQRNRSIETIVANIISITGNKK